MLHEPADSCLAVPASPPGYVSRSRLLAALDAAAEVPLVILSAGSGTGKTVLLAEWARGQGELTLTRNAGDKVARRGAPAGPT